MSSLADGVERDLHQSPRRRREVARHERDLRLVLEADTSGHWGQIMVSIAVWIALHRQPQEPSVTGVLRLLAASSAIAP
jgi:hypothetical protein